MKKVLLGLTAIVVPGILLIPSFQRVQAQALPAPTVDRVGFPEGYRETYKLLETVDNFQNRQIRAIWANPIAASIKPEDGWTFPYGSVLLFESFTVKQDDKGNPFSRRTAASSTTP